jgi:hypothetical protein
MASAALLGTPQPCPHLLQHHPPSPHPTHPSSSATPRQVHYSLEAVPDYVRAAVETAVKLHQEDLPGDILLFFTGQEEVEAAVKLLNAEAQRLARSRHKYKLLPLPLYAGAGPGSWDGCCTGHGLLPPLQPPLQLVQVAGAGI